jgi:hypothetical protein
MQLARRNDLDPFIRQAVALVGPYAWRQLVREARQAGQDFRGAVENALYRVRDHPIDRVGRSSKRERSGNPKVAPPRPAVGNSIIMSDNVNFSRSSWKIGRTRKRSANQIWKSQLGEMKECIYRWQLVSPSLLGPGAIPIGLGANADAYWNQCLPFHIMSLTHHPDFNQSPELGCRAQGMCRTVYCRGGTDFAGDIGYYPLNCQAPTGGTSPHSIWEKEKGSTTASVDSVFHKWTDIRLNLYGSTSYPLTYNVMVVSGMPKEMQVFEHEPCSADVNTTPDAADYPIKTLSPLNEFIIDEVRPMLTNPIKGSNSNGNYAGKLRVLSSRKYAIPCLTYGDAGSISSSTVKSTNVKNVNIFLRHDRFRDYAWHSKSLDEIRNNAIESVGWTRTDVSTSSLSSMFMDVDREERVFLIVTCNSPTETFDDNYNILTTPQVDQNAALKVEGSYDIVVRNCFRNGTPI